METLQQFFITVIATFVFFILIARITIATTSNENHGHHHILKSSINEKTSTKTNTKKKKVRFAVDDNDEYVVNKVILEPSETQSVVFDEPMEDDLVIDYDLQTEMMSVEENVASCSKDEICVKLMCVVDDHGIDEDLKEKEGLVSDEDDDDSLDDGWEGIERSEWEKAFGFASSYGKVDDNLKSLESEDQMDFIRLRPKAGACHEAQPKAL